MKSLFISQLVPQRIVQKYKCSQAAFNFCQGIVCTNYFDAVVSVVPTQVLEKLPWSCEGIKNVQSRLFPHRVGIFRIFNTVIETFSCVWSCLSFKNIWFYNINKHLLFAFLILKFIFRKRTFVILADFDERATSVFSTAWWCAFAIKKADGVISLTARTPLAMSKNMKILPGIIPQKRISKEENQSSFSRNVLFSGSLVASWGINLAIETFRSLPDWNLYISGVASEELQKDLEFKIKNIPNIHYLGFLSFDDYLSLLKSVGCCLSLRDPKAFQNQNNFPSKTLEFLSKGKDVISTINYSELAGVKYTCVDFNVSSLVEGLRRVGAFSEEERAFRRAQNFDWLLDHVSTDAWRNAFKEIEGNV